VREDDSSHRSMIRIFTCSRLVVVVQIQTHHQTNKRRMLLDFFFSLSLSYKKRQEKPLFYQILEFLTYAKEEEKGVFGERKKKQHPKINRFAS
jgi:hypothetical protein